MKKTISLTITGRVQGVGFRYYTQKKAKECSINGFVQNKADGSVYVEASGESIDIETFSDWCNKGPAWARVLEVKKSDLPYQKWEDFQIR